MASTNIKLGLIIDDDGFWDHLTSSLYNLYYEMGDRSPRYNLSRGIFSFSVVASAIPVNTWVQVGGEWKEVEGVQVYPVAT